MSTLSNRLNKHFVAAAAATVAVLGAQQADAALVWSGPININIPSTTAGVYLNVVTGVNAITPAGAPGWDVNPWNSATLSMFAPTAIAIGNTYMTTGTGWNNVAAGTLISPANTFTNATANNVAAPFTVNSSNNLVGFRFANEANANQIHYGWMRISLSATGASQPRAIVEYAYESVAGVGVLAGVVPAPGALALLGLAGLAGTRRRRA
jgi:hypothetical protein